MSISITQQELKGKLEVKLLYAWGDCIETINSAGDQNYNFSSKHIISQRKVTE